MTVFSKFKHPFKSLKTLPKYAGCFGKDMAIALKSYPQAIKFIYGNKEMWPFILLPGVLSITYSFLVSFGLGFFFPRVSNYIVTSWFPKFVLKFRKMRMPLKVLIVTLASAILVVCFKPHVMGKLTPVLNEMAMHAETTLFGSETDFNRPTREEEIQLSKKWVLYNRAVNKFLQMFRTLVLPTIGGTMGALLSVLFRGYYNGQSMVEGVLARKKIPKSLHNKFIDKHKGLHLGLGLGMMAMFMAPIIGWIMAPNVGTMAANIATIKVLRNDPEFRPQVEIPLEEKR